METNNININLIKSLPRFYDQTLRIGEKGLGMFYVYTHTWRKRREASPCTCFSRIVPVHKHFDTPSQTHLYGSANILNQEGFTIPIDEEHPTSCSPPMSSWLGNYEKFHSSLGILVVANTSFDNFFIFIRSSENNYF